MPPRLAYRITDPRDPDFDPDAPLPFDPEAEPEDDDGYDDPAADFIYDPIRDRSYGYE